MKETTKDKFYEILYKEDRDVIGSIVGSFPWTTEYKYRHSGLLFGKAIEFEGKWPRITKYYINN